MMSEDVVASSSVDPVDPSVDSCLEPVKKKQRTDEEKIPKVKSDKLEHRLGGILCCAVCLDLPRTAIYQVTEVSGMPVAVTWSSGPVFHGLGSYHLPFSALLLWLAIDICVAQVAGLRFTFGIRNNGELVLFIYFSLSAPDARLRDETATCPNCRTVISKDLCSRNLAVEKAVCELPAQCQYCSQELPRVQLEHHEAELCEERMTSCRYSRIGCHWRGPHHELSIHEDVCSHPQKSGGEVIEALEIIDHRLHAEQQLYNKIFDLLSFEKITFNDLQFKPYRTDEFIHKLYYETSRFTAFNNQWVVKAHINDNQRDPTQSCERAISYQLVLKSKLASPLGIHFVILKGPFGEMRVHPRLYNHEFSENACESPYQLLALYDTAECNKVLAAKAINFRLIMFQVAK